MPVEALSVTGHGLMHAAELPFLLLICSSAAQADRGGQPLPDDARTLLEQVIAALEK